MLCNVYYNRILDIYLNAYVLATDFIHSGSWVNDTDSFNRDNTF